MMKLFLFLALLTTGIEAHQDRSVYLAGPLFTVAERDFNASLAGKLRELGYTVFLPQEEEPRELTAQAIFEMDVGGIDNSRAVVAIFDGPDPDSGTSWECGYAYAKGKPVVAVRTDFRSADDGGLAPYNLMLSASSCQSIHVSSLKCGIEKVAERIDERLQAIFENL